MVEPRLAVLPLIAMMLYSPRGVVLVSAAVTGMLIDLQELVPQGWDALVLSWDHGCVGDGCGDALGWVERNAGSKTSGCGWLGGFVVGWHCRHHFNHRSVDA